MRATWVLSDTTKSNNTKKSVKRLEGWELTRRRGRRSEGEGADVGRAGGLLPAAASAAVERRQQRPDPGVHADGCPPVRPVLAHPHMLPQGPADTAPLAGVLDHFCGCMSSSSYSIGVRSISGSFLQLSSIFSTPLVSERF